MQPYKKIQISAGEIVPLAKRMKEAGVTLVMIHAWLDTEGVFVVSYEYCVGRGIESYQVTTREKVLPSISAVYDAAAAWPEKEIEELLGLRFEGLDMPGRLFLPEDMLEEEGQIIVTSLKELRAIREAKTQAVPGGE